MGHELRDQLLYQEEVLNMDLCCVDNCSSSLRALNVDGDGTDCICHESYAIAASALGLVFEKILEMDDKARPLYMETIHHADIVTHTSGAVFFSKPWYQVAKVGIEEYNRRREAFDQDLVERERAPILEKLKPKLDAVNEAMNKSESKQFQAFNLLQYIYEHIPPKSGEKLNSELNKDNLEGIKRALLKATAVYHPDGMKWFVLTTEITKLLTNCMMYCKEFSE